jgi:hypothetical protein
MKNEIVLKSGWLKIEKDELDILRRELRNQYERDGGRKPFNSHLPNYNELHEFIKARIYELKTNEDIEINIQGQIVYDIVPGNTFFKDLFYTKKDSDSTQFQEYNIDICYLYALGQTRFQFKRDEKKQGDSSITTSSPIHQKIKIIVSSTLNNMTEAEKVKERLIEEFGFNVETETRNIQTFSKGTLNDLYSNLDRDTYIFSLISRDYLQNETCVKDLIYFTKNYPDLYIEHTLHILLKDIYEGDFNLLDSLGRSELLKYWMLRIEKLEENHKLLVKGKQDKEFYKKLREELDELKEIIEELSRVLVFIKESRFSLFYEILMNKINTKEELIKLLPKAEIREEVDIKLETTFKRIKVPSNNDPAKPEFPPVPFYKPKFPASETYKIYVPGFTNVWLKDESTNPTGTHKDRFAWEVVLKYKSLIEGLRYNSAEQLPQMSIISSGSAAIAIQHLFNLFNIPTALKVLADNNLNSDIKKSITEIGCELYEYDLSKKLLSSEDIKELTNNKKGVDITYREVLDPNHDNYYDWMSYEILKEKPEYCFIPFGTGDLFINVLNIVKMEYLYSFVSKHDPRFFSDIENLKNCSYLGATSDSPNTKLDKLYSNFLPSLNSFKKYMNELKEEYECAGKLTDIYYVEEKYVEKAIEIAEKQNIVFEPSGMAGLALLLQMKSSIPRNAKILIVNTGKTKDVKELWKSYKSKI